jgi:ABC-type transport system involved in multi-copper enzyme maturation permease subunit
MSDIVLFKSSLRDLLRPKRLVSAAILIAIPTALAALFRIYMPAREYDAQAVYNTLASGVVFGFLLVILSVVFGTGVLSQEIEQKTIVYLLTRPVPRWRIMLVKFLAAVVAISVTVWAASLLLALTAFGPAGLTAEAKSVTVNTTDLNDIPGFVTKLRDNNNLLSSYLITEMAASRPTLMMDKVPENQVEQVRQPLAHDLNQLINREEPLYDPERFAGVRLSEQTRRLASSSPTGADRARLNRRLLEEAYPEHVAPVRSPMQLLARDFLVLPVGALAYGAVFLLLATLLNRPLMWGLIFAFGWETWVPTMPGNFQKVSLMSYLRTLAPHPQTQMDSGGFSALLSALSTATITNTLAWTVLLATIVVALALALAIFSNNEYVPREDAE